MLHLLVTRHAYEWVSSMRRNGFYARSDAPLLPLDSLPHPCQVCDRLIASRSLPLQHASASSTRTRDGSLHKNQDMATFLTLQWMSLDVSPDNQPKYTHTLPRASDRVKKVKCIWLVYLDLSHSLAAAIPAL